MFIWKASVILQEIEKHIPELGEQLTKLELQLAQRNLPSDSRTVYGVIAVSPSITA